MNKDNLKIYILNNALDLGNKVNENLKRIRKKRKNYTEHVISSRYGNGEAKVSLLSGASNDDIYILSDIGNYGLTYKFHGKDHLISPDEHFQDIKRVISALVGSAARINVIMPLLYESRQHRRNKGESLDCAMALRELESLGVNNIITCDVHDPNVGNAIPGLPFENVLTYNVILDKLKKNEKISKDKLIIISPDFGAMERANYYAENLKCDVGIFYKHRDINNFSNGTNPIVEHIYIGPDIDGKNAIIVDDMIATGKSLLDTAKKLRQRGAKKIYLVSTFVLLTEGVEVFNEAFNKNLFDKLYTTNLSYIPDDAKKQEWLEEIDCSMLLAEVIDRINLGICANNKLVKK